MSPPNYNNPYTEPAWQCRLHGELMFHGFLDEQGEPVMYKTARHSWAHGPLSTDEVRALGLQLIGLADWYRHHERKLYEPND